MSFPSGGPTGPNHATGNAPRESVDTEGPQGKGVGKHRSNSVTPKDGESVIGKARMDGNRGASGRKIHERTTRKYDDRLDPVGLDSLDEDVDERKLDELLEQQLKSKHPDDEPEQPSPLQSPKQPRKSDDDNPASSELPPSGTTPLTGEEPPAPATRRNVEITSTEEVDTEPNGQQEEEIEAGLKKELSFLDKIPYKKYTIGGVIGAVMTVAGALTFPIGVPFYATGIMMLSMSMSFLYADDGPQDAPPPPPADSKKKKEDDSNKPDDSAKPSIPKNDFLAVENPEFQEAEDSTVGQDEALRRVKDKLLRGERLDPQDISSIEEQVTKGDQEPSDQVARILAPLLKGAGFNPRDRRGWQAVSSIVNVARSAAFNPDRAKEGLADEMKEATREMLNHLPELDNNKLQNYRSTAVTLMNQPGIPKRAKLVLQAHIDAIDEHSGRSHGHEKRSSPSAAEKTDLTLNSGLVYDSSGDIDNTLNRMHYITLKLELMSKTNKDFTERDAEAILNEAHEILSSPVELSGTGFIQELLKRQHALAHQGIINEIVGVQSRFRK